jgi:uncharacterized membrane protein YphA (DoxX/SURF4 family)
MTTFRLTLRVYRRGKKVPDPVFPVAGRGILSRRAAPGALEGGTMILGKVLTPLRELAPLLLRLVVGGVVALNGAHFLGLGTEEDFGTALRSTGELAARYGFAPPGVWAPVIAFGSLLIGLLLFGGLFTRYAALFLALLLGWALLHHPTPEEFKAAAGGFELLLVLLGCALSLTVSGGGWIAADKLLLRE